MISSRARTLRKRFFLTASASDWNDWRWQLRQRIKALDTLEAEDPLREDAHSPVPGLVHRYPDPAATVSCSGSSLREEGYALKAGQLTYDCRYSTMHGMPVTGGRGFRGLKPLWYNGVPP